MNENLALLVGQVAGVLASAPQDRWTAPTTVQPMFDGRGNYMNRLKITRPSGEYTLTIEGPL